MQTLFRSDPNKPLLGFQDHRSDGLMLVVGDEIEYTCRAGHVQESCTTNAMLGAFAGDALTLSVWFRFPRGHLFSGSLSAAQQDSADHKLIIVEPTDGGTHTPRFYVNLRGRVNPTVELYGDYWPGWVTTGLHWPDDGSRHQLEIEYLKRASRFSAWLDGKLAGSYQGPLAGGKPLQPINRISIGAYINNGSQLPQKFYWSDAYIIDAPHGGIVTLPPIIPVPPTGPAWAAVRTALNGAAASLEEAARNLRKPLPGEPT